MSSDSRDNDQRGASRRQKQRRMRAVRRQLTREERERFERMSPAARLKLVRFQPENAEPTRTTEDQDEQA